MPAASRPSRRQSVHDTPFVHYGGWVAGKVPIQGCFGWGPGEVTSPEFGDTAGCQTRNDLNSDSFNANSDSFDPNRDSLIDDASKWQGALRPAEKNAQHYCMIVTQVAGAFGRRLAVGKLQRFCKHLRLSAAA